MSVIDALRMSIALPQTGVTIHPSAHIQARQPYLSHTADHPHVE